MSIELMLMPPSSMYGYYFPIGLNGYDTTSYDASYSDNIVTQQDVDSLMQEISENPHFDAHNQCDKVTFVLPLIFLCIGGIILITLLTSTSGG